MSTSAKAFSARVDLPCRVFCGPDSIMELTGTATSIDTRTLVLAMPAAAGRSCLELGEQVRLELSLPISEEQAASKYLAVRARVSQVTPRNDGSHEVTFTFRKASFKDRIDTALRKPAKSVENGWEM
jgi:hypothetical protein